MVQAESSPRLFALVNGALVVAFLLLFCALDVFGDDPDLGRASPLTWVFHLAQGISLWGLGIGAHALLSLCRIPKRVVSVLAALYFAALFLLLFLDLVYVSLFQKHLDFSILWYARQPGIQRDLAITNGQIALAIFTLLLLVAGELALLAAGRRFTVPRFLARRGQLRLGAGALVFGAATWSCYLHIHPVQATRDVAMVPWFPARAWNLDFPALWSWLPVEPRSVLWEREVEHDYIENSLENAGYAAFHKRYRLPRDIRAQRDTNIVVLAAESWRWDMLDPGTMPNLHAFVSNGAWSSPAHFSTGTRTPEGMHGLFSGQVPFFWYPHYRLRSAPLFFRILKRLGYGTRIWTSSSFAYGDIDETVFGVGIDQVTTINELKTLGHERTWKQRRLEVEDERMVEAFLDDLDRRPSGRSFDFLFFYCTHYNYYYPPDREKYRPALSADFSPNILLRSRRKKLFNRYKNSAHYLDHLLGRILDRLKEKRLLQKTIVIITADHGEEFFERGRFGHTMSTNNYQTRVPLLIRTPAGFSSRYTVTSHADVVPTLLAALGVTPSFNDVLTGKNLLAHDPRNNRAIVSATGARSYPMEFALVEDDFKLLVLNQADRVVLKRVLDLDDNRREDVPTKRVDRGLDYLLRKKDHFGRWRKE